MEKGMITWDLCSRLLEIPDDAPMLLSQILIGCFITHIRVLYADWLPQENNFCLLEVRAMVVAVQQPAAECTAIFTVCIV